MIESGPADDELVTRSREGDRDAFRQLFLRYCPPMMQVAESLLGSQHDAEDAVQNAFIQLHRSLGAFRGDASLRTYLSRIVVNACHDVRRRRRAVISLEDAMVTTSPQAELRVSLQQAIDTLPERMRTCFVLFAVNQWPQNEIAESLGISVGAVKAHVHQAKTRLRPLLES